MLAVAVLGSFPALAADPRRLASSCPGCHTNSEGLNTATPRIRGLPETVIVEAMQAFRADPHPYGPQEYVELELFLAWRGTGLPIETPGVRR